MPANHREQEQVEDERSLRRPFVEKLRIVRLQRILVGSVGLSPTCAHTILSESHARLAGGGEMPSGVLRRCVANATKKKGACAPF